MKIEFHKPKGGLWNVALFRSRYRRMAIFSATLGFLMLLLSSILVLKPVASQPLPGPHLRLHRGTFNARATTQPAPTSALAAPAPGSYAIIQLRGPITLADRQALERTGVKLLEYLPDYAYLVRGTPAQLNAAARLPQVYARTSFTLADKLAPALLRAVARGDNQVGQVRIIGWPDDSGALARDLQASGLTRDVAADVALLLRVANMESVRWIEPAGRPRLVNDFARAIMNVDPIWQSHQLFGTDQIIAIADTGLDTGDMATLSPDFAGRIVATHVLSAGGDWADNHGHGTHSAGSVAGAGVQSGANPAQHVYTNSFAGVAPEASLVIQAFEASPDNRIIGLDPDYYQLFSQAYTDGARLHSDSWGDVTGPISDTAAAYGGYTYGSQRTDQFMWDHPDMAIFFAAGNSGKDGTLVELIPELGLWICTGGDGMIDPDSLIAPGTAKNVVTVGASESNRSSGGLGSKTWNDSNPYLCFATEPIASDLMADDPNGMAAFSSRGPTDDGRVKPDIVAPGTNNVSNRSHGPNAKTLSGVYETNPDYVYSSGTSRTTPLVAGAGALVRQWLISQGLANPSAAAVKATMLNTTQDIAPGQYGTGPQQEIPFARPNSVAGWGRADLSFIDAPAPYTLWLDDHTAALVTGQVISYTHSLSRPLTVLTNTHPLRVMLTWTDPPASLSAGAQLVNDLDLVVIGPGGATYYGNDVASGDRLNNVEGVVINNPSPGQYRVEVHSFNVPIASQPYALAVGGPLKGDNGPALIARKTANVNSAEVGQTISYTYQAINSGPITLTGVIGHDDKLGLVPFSPSTLPPNQSATRTLTYTVKASDLPGPLLNTVNITGTTSTGPVITATTTATAIVNLIPPPAQVYTPVITVTKLADVSTAEVGQTVTYTYWVTNSGTVTLTGLAGDDNKLGPVTFSPNMLAPDESATGTLTYTISVDDLPGPLTNTVEVSGTSLIDPLVTVTSTGVATVAVSSPPSQVYTPAITVTKLADVSTAEVDQTITYTYWVTNRGNVTLTGVIGHDDKLGSVPFNSSSLVPEQSTTGTLTYTIRTSDLPGPLTNTVEVSGTTLVGPLATVTGTGVATVALIGPPTQVYTPAITVTKLADVSAATAGQTITYTYWVTNSGNITLSEVRGTDDRLGAVTFNASTLTPDQSTAASLTYTVKSSDLPGLLTNTVIVSGTSLVDPLATVTVTGIATVSLISPPVQVYTPAITVTKLADVSTTEVGQTITYTYWVTNSGNVTLTGLMGSDDKLGSVSFSPSALAPDETAGGSLTYTVKSSDLPGLLTNTVIVSGTSLVDPLVTVTAIDTATVALSSPPTQVYTPAITVTKLADVSAATAGQTITYTYWVTNSGNVTLTGLTGSDDKLGSVSFNSTSLIPEESTTGTLTYTVKTDDLPGPLINTVEVSGVASIDPTGPVTATAAAIVNLISPPAIDVVKTADVSSAEVDQTITYTYRVTNAGPIILTGVTGSDDQLGTILFSPSTLVPQQSVTNTLTYTVKTGDLPGPLINIVEVNGTTLVGPLATVTGTDVATVALSSSPTQVYTPALTVLKLADVNAAEVGQTVTYTYWVTNSGNVTLTGLAGTDDKLGSVSFNSTSLIPEQSTTGTLTYTVKAGDLPGPLTNTVSVSGTTSVDPPLTVVMTEVATVSLISPPTQVYTPVITVTKLADVSTAEVGQTITYTYWVTNSGNITLNGVTGTDDKLGPVTFSPGILSPDQSTVASLTYTISVDDLPGPLTNTVIVSGTTSVGPLLTATATGVAAVTLTSTPPQTSTPAISILKIANVLTAEVGQTITYTYRVTNSGEITLSRVTGHDDKLGPVTFGLGTLTPDQSTTASLTYTVQSSDLPGLLTNTVIVSGTSLVEPLVTVTATGTATVALSSPPTQVYTPALTVTKLANVSAAEIGQTVTYTYWVTNSGNVTLTGLAGADDKLGSVPFNSTSLIPEGSTTGTLIYTIKASDLPGPLINTVEVSGTTLAGPLATVTGASAATVTLSNPPTQVYTPSLTVTKLADVSTGEVGQTITYTYRVTNSGNITLSTIKGSDDKLGAVPFSPSTLAPQQSATTILTYTIKGNDLPGPLVNLVVVSGTSSVDSPVTVTTMATTTVNLQSKIYLPIILRNFAENNNAPLFSG